MIHLYIAISIESKNLQLDFLLRTQKGYEFKTWFSLSNADHLANKIKSDKDKYQTKDHSLIFLVLNRKY